MLTAKQQEQLIQQAIARRQIALIHARTSAGTTARTCVQFLALDDQDTHLGIWAQVMEGNGRQLEDLANNQTAVEVSFKTAQQGVFFDSTILRQKKKWMNRYVLLDPPTEISTVERRSDSRESVPDGIELCADVTVLAGGAAGQEFSGWIWDISPTGASLVCPAGTETIKPGKGSDLTIRITALGRRQFELPATICNTQRISTSSSRLGVRFSTPTPASAGGLKQLLDDLGARRIKQDLGKELRRRF